MTQPPTIRYVLYIDLENTGRWDPLSNENQRTEVREHCRNYFKKICEEFHPENDSISVRGDDFMIWFETPWDVVKAGIKILEGAEDKLTRTNPHKELLIRPRIIAFSADVCTEKGYETATAQQVDNIMPVERDVGKVGFLVICERLYSFLEGGTKKTFLKDKKTLGKRGAEIQIYRTKKKYKFQQWEEEEVEIEKRRNYIKAIYVIMMYNILSRNVITMDLIGKIKRSNNFNIDGEWFAQTTLETFRQFLESIIEPPKEEWTFKLSLWEKATKNFLEITHLAYPKKLKSPCYEKGKRVKVGSNLVGKVWKEQKAILIPDLKKAKRSLYQPLHDARDKSICSMAAFPILSSKQTIGVVSIDTNVMGFYKEDELPDKFHEICASSFTNNLALGILLKKTLPEKRK